MHAGKGHIDEITSHGRHAARVACAPGVIPAPGQYVLTRCQSDVEDALAFPVFSAGSCPGGFYAAPPLPVDWRPGTQIDIRGPLGKGFQLPLRARFVALAVFNQHPARLLALAEQALAQNAGVVVLMESIPDGLPAAIEVAPLAALRETLGWADYAAFDLPRPALAGVLYEVREAAYSGDGQALVETALPCGGMGECGVCAVQLRKGHRLACKDGPVFDLKTLME